MRGNESLSSVEGTLSRGKRDQYLEGLQTLSERKNLHVYLEQKAEWAVQGECQAQKKTIEAQIGQKEIENKDVLTLPLMKPIENSHLKDWNCVRRINGQIRLKEKRLIFVEGWK